MEILTNLPKEAQFEIVTGFITVLTIILTMFVWLLLSGARGRKKHQGLTNLLTEKRIEFETKIIKHQNHFTDPALVAINKFYSEVLPKASADFDKWTKDTWESMEKRLSDENKLRIKFVESIEQRLADLEKLNTEIKPETKANFPLIAGKEYLCKKDLIMESGFDKGKRMFTKGFVYKCDINGNLTNNKNEPHGMREMASEFFEEIKKAEQETEFKEGELVVARIGLTLYIGIYGGRDKKEISTTQKETLTEWKVLDSMKRECLHGGWFEKIERHATPEEKLQYKNKGEGTVVLAPAISTSENPKAEPTMTNEELLEKAKRDYPVGTVFLSACTGNKKVSRGDFNFNSNSNIADLNGYRSYVYYNGKWAEIISKPASPEVKPTVTEVKEDAFVLPENFYVVVTKENQEMLSKWLKKGFLVSIGKGIGMCSNKNEMTPHKGYTGKEYLKEYGFGTEITTEHFKKYVYDVEFPVVLTSGDHSIEKAESKAPAPIKWTKEMWVNGEVALKWDAMKVIEINKFLHSRHPSNKKNSIGNFAYYEGDEDKSGKRHGTDTTDLPIVSISDLTEPKSAKSETQPQRPYMLNKKQAAAWERKYKK